MGHQIQRHYLSLCKRDQNQTGTIPICLPKDKILGTKFEVGGSFGTCLQGYCREVGVTPNC
jgi:hypothetical protein